MDNARIEIEGGAELPVVDGSAVGWVLDIRAAGVRPADGSGEGQSPALPHSPVDSLCLHEGDAFISFVPGPTLRFTAGVEFQAPVIGRQWHSWSPETDPPFRHEIAPARRHLESLDAAKQLIDEGLMLGGADRVMVLAAGRTWLDPSMLRLDDEAARHAIQQFLGLLALAGGAGRRLEPRGHILMYKAPLDLQLRFVRSLMMNADPVDDA